MFDNPIKTEWVGRRDMRLLGFVTFTDKTGQQWTARAGDVVDGASIPKFFWRFIGSPFIGKYRRPSVIHDVLCVRKDFPYKQVHALFYEMMLCEGVPTLKAKAMYYAVRFFGPKWYHAND